MGDDLDTGGFSKVMIVITVSLQISIVIAVVLVILSIPASLQSI